MYSTIPNLVILRICVVVSIALCVFGGGRLELKLNSYTSGGLDATGDHCDSFLYLFRTSKCDYFFDIDIDAGDSFRDSIRTKVYENADDVHFDGSLGSSGNPIVNSFSEWQGYFRLYVKVTDDDYMSGNDHVADLSGSFDIPADGAQRQRSIGGKSQLHFTVKVECDPQYYGAKCNRRCVPKNDDGNGHFICTNEGLKLCRPGWRHPETDCRDQDPCVPTPCHNEGRCRATADSSYSCECLGGYRGPHCEERIRPCELHDPCVNGGKCLDIGWTNSTCKCLAGWTGQRCEKDIDECSQSPCFNKAACINTRGSYWCRCNRGFEGKHCENDINECLTGTASCLNGGTCINTIGNYFCGCPEGFDGEHCEDDIDECHAAQSPCLNKAACINTRGSYWCSCNKGFDGKHCENDVNECLLDTSCLNGGTCINTVGGYNCSCTEAYNGTRCEFSIPRSFASQVSVIMAYILLFVIVAVVILWVFLNEKDEKLTKLIAQIKSILSRRSSSDPQHFHEYEKEPLLGAEVPEISVDYELKHEKLLGEKNMAFIDDDYSTKWDRLSLMSKQKLAEDYSDFPKYPCTLDTNSAEVDGEDGYLQLLIEPTCEPRQVEENDSETQKNKPQSTDSIG